MKKLISLIVLMTITFFSVLAEDVMPEYVISGAGVGSQGTYLVDVSVIVKKAKDVDEDMLARCAVHGVLFKGFSSKENRQSQKPLAGSPAVEATHADYFTNFFKQNGPATGYADVLSPSIKSVKSGKMYRVSATVSVNKDQLHKDLESAGVIKGLNSIF